MPFKELGTLAILSDPFGMLPSVDFDYQSSGVAIEIDYEWWNWYLAFEFSRFKLPTS